MLFSSTIFLFLFLPVVLAGVFVVHPRLRNGWLLIASLVFYAWGEPFVVAVMLLSVATNWGLGLWIGRARESRLPIMAAVAFNLGLLLVFKYAEWLTTVASDLLLCAGLREGALPRLSEIWTGGGALSEVLFTSSGEVRLPIGVSFFTFQAMSYAIDVHRGACAAQRNPIDLGLYISMFPQLIAGPIVRYRDVSRQIAHRAITLSGFSYGARRFMLGLSKKMLIANTAAETADTIFAISSDALPPQVAWLGVLCYTAQIYFDFSGYSDMAIGLGSMLGFRFRENFNYPYVARSITEFWRRWHISLSTWFRDYVYIPLGGNRRGAGRTYINLVIVFALCGLWHGASFSFLAWGMLHGGALILERVGLGEWLGRQMVILRHAYVLLVVMVGWVLFRADTLGDAARYLSAMAFLSSGDGTTHHIGLYLEPPLRWALVIGLIAATPILPWMIALVDRIDRPGKAMGAFGARFIGTLFLFAMFFLSCVLMASDSYNPFLYFRF